MTQTTPREIDTALATIAKRQDVANRALNRTLDTAHRAFQDRRNGRYGWMRSDADVEAQLRSDAATFERTPWTVYDLRTLLVELDAAYATVRQCQEDRAPLDAAYKTAPWSRFFIVTSSDGHIHSSMECQTCRPRTEFGWLPELSGQTEADAVAAHGPLLCSVCFPTAPVEWTIGAKASRPRCTGVNQPATDVKHFARSSYGTCQGCGERHPINASGKPRAHKPAK